MSRCFQFFALCFMACAMGVAQRGGMNYFAGTWELDGRVAGNFGAQPDYKATWLVEKGLDTSFCLAGHVVLNGKNFTRELITYNAAKKVYERCIWADDGSHFVFSTPGWNKNILTWTGTQYKGVRAIAMKEAVTMASDDEFSAAFYSQQNGKWVLLLQEVLHRVN